MHNFLTSAFLSVVEGAVYALHKGFTPYGVLVNYEEAWSKGLNSDVVLLCGNGEPEVFLAITAGQHGAMGGCRDTERRKRTCMLTCMIRRSDI